MKSLFLSITAIFCSFQLFAQHLEFGVNGGMSSSSKPYGAMYQGKDGVNLPTYGLSIHNNYRERWQVGLNVGITSWQRNDKWPLVGTNNQNLGVQNVNLVAAKQAVTFAFQFNHTIPFYSNYDDLARFVVYFGAAAGPVFISNDAEVEYNKVNPNTPSEYVYTSAYHFERGYGLMLGGQVGCTYFLSQKIGININCSPSVAWAQTNDSRLGGTNKQFNITYIPTTLGIRFRF